MGNDVSFGGHVRIVETDDTRGGGWVGLGGHCWGVATPSVTGVGVVGGPAGDLALNVHFADDDVPDAWF
jgi:hypothetical protein